MAKHARYIVQRTDVARPHYWAGGGKWTTVPLDAIRFYRRSTAYESWTLDHLPQDGGVKVTVVSLTEVTGVLYGITT